MYGVSDNAVRKWFKLAKETPIKIKKRSSYITDERTGERVKKQHNEIIRSKTHFKNRESFQLHEIETGKLKDLDIFEYERLKKTMSIRAIAKMYNVKHPTLIKKFSRKIHTDKLLNQ